MKIHKMHMTAGIVLYSLNKWPDLFEKCFPGQDRVQVVEALTAMDPDSTVPCADEECAICKREGEK